MRELPAAQAAALATSLGLERLPASLEGVSAWTDGASVCLHRGSAFADDWVREAWFAAPPGQWLAAARRYCRQLFASGVRQLRWTVPLPVDPRHEAVWSRYGVLPIAVRGDELTLALDNPSIAPSSVMPWPRIVPMGLGLSLGPVRYNELRRIAEWAALERNYGPLGYTRPVTLEQLIGTFLPANPLHHARSRTHVYALRKRGEAVGAVFERQRDYEGDDIRELDIVIVDETLPMQAWAHASTIVGDICCRRGVQRFVINVREELGGVAALFGAVPATQWIARSETTRTHYAATRAQFYKSLSVRRFLRHRVNA